ncbi:hypothetical protein C0995_011202 [Termitomyces sp. Mi166|nr:hypothetical protein C0995_011202 [Termitomyces sp. Mi166\
MKRNIVAELKDGRRIRGMIEFSVYHRLRFPSKTRGFLYCHHDPRLPPTTGEVRFRVTETSDPTCFQNGTDLMRPDGSLPWSISLLQLRSTHEPFKELAIQDGIIQPGIFNFGKFGVAMTFLEQPFVVTLDKTRILHLIDLQQYRAKKSVIRILLPIPGKHGESELKGKLLVRFERASLTEHVNDTSIVMRVLKILEPIRRLREDATVSQPTPQAGALLKSLHFSQIRCIEFDEPFLRLLPSITATPLPPSNLKPIADGKVSALVSALPRTISTLNPSRIQPSDFMFLSGRVTVNLPSTGTLYYKSYGVSAIPYPPNTQGFFYMHLQPHLPLLTGQIRFRVTPSNDPTQFEKGTDLLYADGQPWNVNALQIAHFPSFAYLKEQLHRDGYVEFLQALLRLPKQATRQLQRILCYLEQPFVVNMSHLCVRFSFISADQVRRVKIGPMFNDSAVSSNPYTGRLLLRFEQSTLPEHVKGNFVVLRVLKILEPIKLVDPNYNKRLPIPRVGELVTKTNHDYRSYNLDDKTCSVRGLKYLPSIPDDQPNL